MDCGVIQDLLPLYTDDCCSEESRRLVEAHLRTCPVCLEYLQGLQGELPGVKREAAPARPTRVREWRASLFQSVLLFAAFGIITFGVSIEASSGYEDFTNSLAAFWIVVPAAGFLLSLPNWYFVRLYRSQKSFVLASLCLTAVLTAVAYGWCLWHYEVALEPGLVPAWLRLTVGPCLVAVAISPVCAGIYARLLGKE